MMNAVLAALVSAPDDATSVYPLPALSMDKLGKLATPFAALTAVDPEGVPPAWFAPRARVTVALGTPLPKASRMAAATAGVIAAPAVPLLGGWTVNASVVAAAGPMVNAALVVLVSVPDAAANVYPVPALSIVRPLKLATPFTAFTVAVPESVPPLGFTAIATVTAFVALGTVLPEAS
jgi:hypothetical protein